MKRTTILVCISLIFGMLTGCSTDPVQDTLNRIKTQADQASGKLAAIRGELKKVADKAEKDNKKITIEDLKPTFKDAEKLRKVGQDLMALKAAADIYKTKVDDEKRKTLNAEFGPKLAGALRTLQDRQQALDATLQRVMPLLENEKTKNALTEAMRNAKQEFAALTRQK